MKAVFYLIPVFVLSVTMLIRAELLNLRTQSLIFKPISSLLVIAAAAAAFWEPTQQPVYTAGVLVGLVFSLGGDIALLFQDDPKAFKMGLVLFLIAQITYTIVFILLGQFSMWDTLSAALLLAAAVGVFRLLSPGLGALKVPVIVYIAAISLMVNRAIGTFSSASFSEGQAWMIACGALLFYLSDVILALNRFWKPIKYHRINLAMYYAGQMLIALAAILFI